MTEAVWTDQAKKKMERWELPTWGTDEEVAIIRDMSPDLGPLDDCTRKIRTHIASLAGCDSGVPATIDELLNAIGRGVLAEPALRNGCDHPGFCVQIKTTQPRQLECMRAIHDVLTARLADRSEEELINAHPYAITFIQHAYQWLPPDAELSDLQKLLVERMLLPFEYLTEDSHADPSFDDSTVLCGSVMRKCYESGGRGSQIDSKIEQTAGLPKIKMAYPEQARKADISDPAKRDLYVLCCSLAHGLHTLCDCHHSTFRWIENWVYAIGTGRWGIPTRQIGTESARLYRLMFGYLLGLDRWLLDAPEHFVLLDLGHVDLGFDPKNEIVRVYAYLGSEHTPVKIWLAAYLWTNLMYNNGGPLWRNRHRDRLDEAEAKGVSVRRWIDGQLE